MTIHIQTMHVPRETSDGDALFDLARWKPMTSKAYFEALFTVSLNSALMCGVLDVGQPLIPTQYEVLSNGVERLITYAVVRPLGGPAFVTNEPFLLALVTDKDRPNPVFFRRTDVEIADPEDKSIESALDDVLPSPRRPFSEDAGMPPSLQAVVDADRLRNPRQYGISVEADLDQRKAESLFARMVADGE